MILNGINRVIIKFVSVFVNLRRVFVKIIYRDKWIGDLDKV